MDTPKTVESRSRISSSLPSRISRVAVSGPLIALTLLSASFIVRLPFLSRYPVNWDSVQYVLGIESFNLESHQPHPPGYIGYIMLGRLFTGLFGDPHTGLVMLSVVSGAIATAAMYGLARCWLDRQHALITTVLFGTSPLIWYYSGVALNYIVEAAIVIPFAWLCYRSRVNQDWRDLLLATLLLATLGAVRQSGFVLLVPLWLYTLWPFPWRKRIEVAGLLSLLTLLWLVPLLWLSGGPFVYWRESRALGALVSGRSTLLGSVMERVGYLSHLSLAFLFGMMAAVVVLVLLRRYAVAVLRDLSTHDKWFFLLWAVPSIATYVLGHMGQFGYVLTILPIPFLWIGMILARLPRSSGSLRYAASLPLCAFIVLANTFAFTALPGGALTVAHTLRGDESNLARYVRQYDIPTNDRYWDDLVSTVKIFPADSTVVLATVGGPRVSGGYRHFSYYLPEYEIYGLGRDGNGVFGQMFNTRDGESDYSIAGLSQSQRVLLLPEHVHFVVTADPEVINRIPDALSPLQVSGSDVVFIRRPAGMNLAFLPGDQIVACHCSELLLTGDVSGDANEPEVSAVLR